MILGDVFERFAQETPLSVMARGVMENALNPQVLDTLFEDVADKQYTKQLLFSSIVDLMSLVVCRIQPAIHAELLDCGLLPSSGRAQNYASARPQPRCMVNAGGTMRLRSGAFAISLEATDGGIRVGIVSPGFERRSHQ